MNDRSLVFSRSPLPERLYNLQRLCDEMERRGLDGIVAMSPAKVFYLSGLNGIAHKSDEPRPYAVVLSRHQPQHPVLIVADYYINTVACQPSWVSDMRASVRPHRAAIERLEGTPRA